MARKKERETRKANFNLSPETIERIEELSKFENTTKSSFIEMLVVRWDEGINPQSKLNSLFKKRELVGSELASVDSEIKKLTTEISSWEASKRDKARKKPEAIRILKGLLKNNEVVQAEKVSRFWQAQTGIPSFELLMDARGELEKQVTIK